jgi:hypothetical protein
MQRLVATDADVIMPPPSTGKAATPAQIALLKAWIEKGAEYRGHWSFVRPQRSTVPESAQPNKVVNPIDNFIHARLSQAGLKPAAEADRVALIRRVTLDLTGLPPTPAEVDAFLADTDDRAWEKLVDTAGLTSLW